MNRSKSPRDRGSGRHPPSRDELLARSDEQLVDFVLDGHDAAFDVLFDRHVADSLWYAREVLGTWGEAEEAVRHAFAAAHAYLATRGHETEFWPWLQTILGNYCLSMLQARVPGPEKPKDEGTVVDLGEWRLRRKLSGVALPVAPAAGLREGLMAVCGIGTGAAAGAPLIGGTLAKLAVVAVLAGGAGIAGKAVHEQAGPAHARVQVSAERAHGGASRVRGSEAAPGVAGREQGRPVATVRKLDGAPRATRERLPLRGGAPTAPAPGSPVSVDAAPDARVVPAPADVAPVQVADSLVQRVADAVEAQAPPGGDLSQIGDDLGVSALTPPVDARALLSQGVAVLRK